ncbi:transcription termination factor NusA [bacterium]|nr:transcription termination factor NusA [bacterium]NBX77954.1 transcription termination factor NusA [bacterium]
MLNDVILELVDERGLDLADLHLIVKEGILAAYTKKYPTAQFRVELNPKANSIQVEIAKEVVVNPEDELVQISVRKARFIQKDVEAGQTIWVPFEGGIGRVEILKAKQVIASRIRDIEALGVYEQFKDKLGEIVHGTIHKLEKSGVVVSMRDVSALLPKSHCIPQERYVPGRPVRALLKEVHQEYRGDSQLILDRASVEFLVKVLELEIPEVYDKLIEIKAAARRAGYKSKIIVSSNDPNIDPVGTCVGVGGARIKPILKEFGGEKIDIISWANSKEELIKSALRPAEVNRVEIQSDGSAKVWISDDQRAYAIGKMGQNIALASELLGMNIELISSGAGVSEHSVHDASDIDDYDDVA